MRVPAKSHVKRAFTNQAAAAATTTTTTTLSPRKNAPKHV